MDTKKERLFESFQHIKKAVIYDCPFLYQFIFPLMVYGFLM